MPVAPAAPDTPSAPSPSNGATAYYTVLSWTSARATKADVYLGTSNPPTTLVGVRVVGNTFVPTVTPGTTYYWQVVAYNDGGSATGPVWSFTMPAATAQIVALNGSVTTHARVANSSVSDLMNAQPNTASLTFDAQPTAGQAVQIGIGTLDAANLVFSGEIQSVDQSYVDTTGATLWPCSCIDWTFQLNQRRPFGSWTNTSATAIAQQVIAQYAPGFSSAGVQTGLAAVTINFDGSADFATCMTTLATACGAYYGGPDYTKSIQIATTATSTAATPLTNSTPPLNVPTPITFSTDLSQVRTRVYGKGASATVAAALGVSETIIPVSDASQFTAAGGSAIIGRASGAAQTDVITYAGVVVPAGGSLVGPGQSPSTAPTVAAAAGSGLGTGAYQYAYTDVTASGESLPSPLGSVTTGGTVAPPVSVWSYSSNPGGGSQAVGYYGYAVTFANASGETTSSPRYYAIQISAPGQACTFTNLITSPTAGVTKRMIYRTAVQATSALAGTAQLQLLGTVNDNTTTTYTDQASDAVLGVNIPTSNTLIAGAASLSAIAVGPSGTTSRKVYRTTVGGSQLKLLTTIADNTTTTYSDSTADGSLGANAPTSDTSGLAIPSGQVLAGATSMVTTGAGPFSATGGWAAAGSGGQVFRYTGLSGNTLTGIPASGPGAILTTVTYNSQVVPVAALTGVNSGNGLFAAVAKGSTVAIWVRRDSAAEQTALAALEGTDGIREYLITDGRMSEPTLTATCDADLATFASPVVTVTYYTRDVQTRAGRTVAINLTASGSPYGLAGTFTIQRVDLTFDGPGLYPLRKVTASSTAFTLQDLLRRVTLT